MALTLGIDTGGTFTDAVVVNDQGAVLGSAKSPTTHADLAVGVAGSLDRVLSALSSQSGTASDIGLVCISTTLATNALVEGHGDAAGLMTFGFSDRELDRAGIASAVPPSLRVNLPGGHDAHGMARVALDLDEVAAHAHRLAAQVTAFAIAAQFSVRNPAHELEVADVIQSTTGLPTTCSHTLSARLDGPRRALTAALNARLLGVIDRLHQAVVAVLEERGIAAPVMVVRGDGSLVSADFAARRPIETVLSGPAASVIGALHLSGLDSGVVVDMGGTTTDVAVVTEGRPGITQDGAVVGGHRTMIEAVDMATIGLGGDSQVSIDPRHQDGPLVVGPERAIPIGRLALEFPDVHRVLDAQLAEPIGLTTHATFLVAIADPSVTSAPSADGREVSVLERLQAGPLPIAQAAATGLEQRAAARLRAKGHVRIATLTPTDARCVVHGTEPGQALDEAAAVKAASLFARQAGAGATTVAVDAHDLAAQVLERVISDAARFVAGVALDADGIDHAGAHELVGAALHDHVGVTHVRVALTSPLTAIGAPAGAYFDHVARRLGTTSIVPRHAEVANAIGAVAGRVRIRRSVTITQPSRGQYRVHADDQPTFGSVENARADALDRLRRLALADAVAAGADTPELSDEWDEQVAEVGGKEIFVQGTLTVLAAGRPRFG